MFPKGKSYFVFLCCCCWLWSFDLFEAFKYSHVHTFCNKIHHFSEKTEQLKLVCTNRTQLTHVKILTWPKWKTKSQLWHAAWRVCSRCTTIFDQRQFGTSVRLSSSLSAPISRFVILMTRADLLDAYLHSRQRQILPKHRGHDWIQTHLLHQVVLDDSDPRHLCCESLLHALKTRTCHYHPLYVDYCAICYREM